MSLDSFDDHRSPGDRPDRLMRLTSGISEALLWLLGLALVVVAVTLAQEYYDGFEFIMTGSWLFGDRLLFFPKSPLLSAWLGLIEFAAGATRLPIGLPLFHLAMLLTNGAAIAASVLWIRRRVPELSVSIIALVLVANRVLLHYAPFAMTEIPAAGLIACWLLARDRERDAGRRSIHAPSVILLALIALLRPQMALLPLTVGFIDALLLRRFARWIRASFAAGALYFLITALFFAHSLDCGLLEGLRQLADFLVFYFKRCQGWETHPWWVQPLHLGFMLSPAGIALLAWWIDRRRRDLAAQETSWRTTAARYTNHPDLAVAGGGLAYLFFLFFLVTASEARYLLPLWPLAGWIVCLALAELGRRRPRVAALVLLAIVLFALPGPAAFRDAFYRTPLAESLSRLIAAEARGGTIVLAMPTLSLHPGGEKIFTRFDSSFTIHDWGAPAFAFHARQRVMNLPPGATFTNSGFPIPDHLPRLLAPGDLLVVPDSRIITTSLLPDRMNPATLVRWGVDSPTMTITVETTVWNPVPILEAARRGPGPLSSAIRHLTDGARSLGWALLALAVAAGLGRLAARLIGNGASLAEEILIGFLVLGTWNLVVGSTAGLSPPLLYLPVAGLLALRPKEWRAAMRQGAALFQARDPLDGVALRIAVAGLLIALASAWMPPVGMDALTYHLALPDQYQIRGSVLPVATNAYHLYWQQAETAFIQLVRLDPSGRAVGLFVFMLWIAGLAGCGALASRLGGSTRFALLAGATSPLLINLIALTKPDMIGLGLVAWGARGLGDPDAGRRRLGALLLGGAGAIKPSAAFLVLPLWLLTFRRPDREWMKETATLAALPLLWIARNLIHSGRALPGGYQVTLTATETSGGGPLASAVHFLRASAIHFRDGTDGPIGPLLVVAMVIAAARLLERRHAAPFERRLAGAGLIGWLLWLWAGKGQARLLLPVLVAWIPSLSLAWRDAKPFGRRLFILLAVLSLAAGLLIVEDEHAVARYGIGVIDRASYYSSWLDSHAIQEEADRILPADARVFAIGDAELFPLHRRAEYDGYWESSRAFAWAHEAHDTGLVIARLRAQGFTHLLYNPGIMNRLIARGLMPPPLCPDDRAVLDAAIRSLPALLEDRRLGIGLYSLTPAPSAKKGARS